MPSVPDESKVHAFVADILKRTRAIAHWSLANVPWGVRSAIGLLFIAGAVFSFLPVLGLWMGPVGIVLVSLDFPPWRNKVLGWLRGKQKQEEEAAD
jgi:hypothetical protein